MFTKTIPIAQFQTAKGTVDIYFSPRRVSKVSQFPVKDGFITTISCVYVASSDILMAIIICFLWVGNKRQEEGDYSLRKEIPEASANKECFIQEG